MFGRRGAAVDNRPLCRFFQQGNCRFGQNCKFRHEGETGQTNNINSNINSNIQHQSNRNSNWNNNNHSSANQQNNFRNNNNFNNRAPKQNPYLLDRDAIIADLDPREEKPQWPLSAYGPGRDAPRQLLEGECEVSPEELRVQCYLARANGRVDEYAQHETRLFNEAAAAAQSIVSRVDDAIQFVKDGETSEQNRIKASKTTGNFPRDQQGFGRPSQDTPSSGLTTFGHTSQSSQNPVFSASLGSQGLFAKPQPPAPGSTPAFGQATPINSGGFGQPSHAQTSTFGKPSVIGQPTPISSGAFGQPSQPQTSTFGKPSAMGQPPATNSGAFGQLSQPQISTFGRPSFTGQPQQPSSLSASSRPPAMGNTPAFGQSASSNSGAFGQPSQPQTSTFGKPSLNFSGQAPDSQPSAKQTNPTSSQKGPAPRHPGDKKWFPNGHPGPEPSAEAATPDVYEGSLGEALKAVYQKVWATGEFGDVVPEIPPKREWVNFEV